MRPAKFLRVLSLASVLAVFTTQACESDTDDLPPSLTEACDACLSREACSVPWEACIEDSDCKQYISCVLRADCYTMAQGSDCEERAGCELETSSEESQQASDDFETCARTECAEICGFAEP